MASSSSTHGPSSAVRALALELKSLQDDPLEGIRSKLVNDENMFEWEVALFGPPETLYEGGYFKVGAGVKKRRLEIMTSTQESKLGLLELIRVKELALLLSRFLHRSVLKKTLARFRKIIHNLRLKLRFKIVIESEYNVEVRPR